jgi:tyrosyl-tRNA synthetase
MASVEEQMAVLMRGVEYGDPHIQRTMEEDLRERLKLGRPLRVYCGFDPTFTGLTLGNMVPMLKLGQFQRFGHEVIFLMGTMTATVGDPTDKAAARQQLTLEEVQANCQNWLEQAYRVLDPDKTVVKYNADWLAPLDFADVVQLASHFTVAEFLAHETFKKRMDEGRPLYIHEFIYALMQAYDAHHLQTDVQVGGIDQLFNIMAGRKLQQALGEQSLIALCTPLLVGTDGALKMSKSVGNSINLDMTPSDMYGKLMSIPDSLMPNYYTLLTDVSQDELDAIAAGKTNAMESKKRLAHLVVALLHDEAAADAAQENFEITHQTRTPWQTPDALTVDSIPLPDGLVDIEIAGEWRGNQTVQAFPQFLHEHGFASSVSAARNLIQQEAIRKVGIDLDRNGSYLRQHPQVLQGSKVSLEEGAIVRVGPHRFFRVVRQTAAEG